MRRWPIEAYGEAIAHVYDEILEPMAEDTVATVKFLLDRAGGGRALELGVGTGRIALPLASCGVNVHGIDASAKMIAKLRDKAGGLPVTSTIADFGAVSAPGTFDLVYVVFNTFYGLWTQELQVACVEGVARKLRPGGTFVVEAFVPGQIIFEVAGRMQDGSGDWSEVVRHDVVGQRIVARQVLRTVTGTKVLPVHMRYVWPSELDLMARIAGLTRTARYGGWNCEPFTDESNNQVSVYTKPPAPELM